MASQTPGRKTFMAGAIVLVLFGAVHLLAIYQGNFVPPPPGPEAELDRMAREIKQEIGPFEASAFGLIQLLNASYSVLLLYAGAVSLVAVGPAAAHGSFRRLTITNLILAALLLFLTILYQFPPPMLFAAAALILFTVSFLLQRRSSHGQIP